ncbi:MULTISPECIES: alpha/beta hydrolase [unclassified Streptomyces]|uniref:alpha/beta hydrolase n=1 Tax=unclassified Streptomyces TaxID=2593676 RepID=UPI002DDB817A|nr:alpha/beta hydrolase [Streptomyces sp. NBC_01750]WSA98124.1 alpha/beta hydrolase [Streptomyces sp. NBC_01794]WSD37338.1 alpha/beta hydrolase [Streptomyces sp. NBC_01750]
MHIPRSIAGHRHYAAALAAAVICSTIFAVPDLSPAGGGPSPSVPAPQLDWKPCVQGSPFDCATAKVPLDYLNPGLRTIELAVIRHKATGPGRRIGTLFFNPGGPGGPGTVQMPQNYESFPQQVRERFDIVSWDPRGVGNSTAVNCFGSRKEADAWNASKAAGFPVGEQQRTAFIAAYKDLARRCQQRDPELLRHVSTADTARDLDQLRQAVGDPQLTYLGISYGTFLGATYANLYPGKVRAMVFDSNVDPQAWTHASDPPLTTFLRMGADRGAAAVLDKFLALCGSTTTARCAFSAGSPKATRDKFDQLMRRLREHPVGAWTYSRTVADAVNSLYVVHPGWTGLAGRLQNLWQGRVPEPSALPPAPPVPNPNPYLGDEQAGAVFCSDSPNPRDPAAYHAMEEVSATRAGDAGRFWTWAAEGCADWPATAANIYRGPWNKATAHPVLVVGTTYDPATPYSGAQAMAKQLANARLLTNNGYGHTELINPSSCVKAYESRYLIDGTLPPAGATCQQDTPPFAAPKPQGGVATGGGAMADVASLVVPPPAATVVADRQ